MPRLTQAELDALPEGTPLYSASYFKEERVYRETEWSTPSEDGVWFLTYEECEKHLDICDMLAKLGASKEEVDNLKGLPLGS